jgi:hypothetical protein
VYTRLNTDMNVPDGVLLFGDIVNGKIGFNEMIVSEFDDGYSGTYFYDSNTSQFILLASVRYDDGNLVIDEEIPEAHTSLQRARASRLPETIEGSFAGDSIELTSDDFETSVFYSCTQETTPLLDAVYNPSLYQVRTNSNAHWIALRKRQLAIQVVSILVQVISSIVISWLLFLPIHRFVQVIQKELGHAATGSSRKRAGVKDLFDNFKSFGSKDNKSTKASTGKDSEDALSVA